MYITDIQVRDVVFQIEFTLEDITLLKKALENTTLELSSLPEEEKEPVKAALNRFYDVCEVAVNGEKDE